MAAGGVLRVDREALAYSAAQVTGQGEDLATAHLSSDDQIVAAQPGWVGCSALAMSAKSAQWPEDSRRLVTSVGDHAVDLNNAVDAELAASTNMADGDAPMPGSQPELSWPTLHFVTYPMPYSDASRFGGHAADQRPVTGLAGSAVKLPEALGE